MHRIPQTTIRYFEPWVNLMIVSVFAIESRQAERLEIVNPKHSN